MDVAAPAQITPLALDTKSSVALASLLPLLGCGEEAAALAFDGLAAVAGNDLTGYALNAIAAEERIHDALLRGLLEALPHVSMPADVRRTTRRFHVELGRGGPTLHLARIAAIDAGVCTILSRLLRPGTPLSRERHIYTTLNRIRRDEVRHVSVSRTLASAHGESKTLCAVGAAAREGLAAIVMHGADTFEVLGVDPDRLKQDIARLPNGLFGL